jgi:hypothetical protein
MVLLLVFDVFNKSFFRFDGHRKGSISNLPTPEVRENPLPFDKIIAGKLDVLHQRGNRNGGVDVRQNMDVVLHTIDPVEVAIFIREQLVDVGQQSPFL